MKTKREEKKQDQWCPYCEDEIANSQLPFCQPCKVTPLIALNAVRLRPGPNAFVPVAEQMKPAPLVPRLLKIVISLDCILSPLLPFLRRGRYNLDVQDSRRPDSEKERTPRVVSYFIVLWRSALKHLFKLGFYA
jgi:hypothetical protein